ncbi:hypothetical protein [Parapedobacter koreensis]|uniref:Secreted protein n=1 Tax=Parapedobacter koreensis TaxID=332977 RepID=A0A1H7QX03_9SPHI|nr:hypothetical protein [Parapedobacter koreensis]SEL51827.1 hypothetical protein SAMN05421740_106128 [Parapedobacter koreensis]
MKKKVLFYSVLGLILAGSVSLATVENAQVSDVIAVASSDNSSEMYPNSDERLREIAEHGEETGEEVLPEEAFPY